MKFPLTNGPPVSVDGFVELKISEIQYKSLIENSEEPFPYCRVENMLCLLSAKKVKDDIVYRLIPISTYLNVKHRYKDVHTGKYRYCLEVFNEDKAEFVVEAEVLTLQGLKILANFGILYDELYAKNLQRFLVSSARKAETINTHTQLGWNSKNFFSLKCHSKNAIDSVYQGEINFTPMGFREWYISTVKKDVMPYPALLFIWLLGFASVILSYLNKSLDLGCLMFHLNNSSSRGKTTAAMLATSVTSSPKLNDGLMTSLNSTNAAIVEYVAQASGHTIALDELGCTQLSDNTLYELSQGQSKRRLDSSGQPKPILQFNSVILITGEFSVIKDDSNTGVKVRVFEITDDLTTSAEHSNSIKSSVTANHALLFPEYLDFVVGKVNTLLKDYNKACKYLKANYKSEKGALTDRALEKLAVVYLTAKLVEKCFSLGINLNVIKDYIYKLESQVETNDTLADTALNTIMQYVLTNIEKFKENCFEITTKQEGRIVHKGSTKKLYVFKDVVERELKKAGFQSTHSIFKEWKTNGTTECYKDRTYMRLKFSDDVNPIPCFVFKCPDFSGEFQTIKSNRKYKTPVSEPIDCTSFSTDSSSEVEDSDIDFKKERKEL